MVSREAFDALDLPPSLLGTDSLEGDGDTPELEPGEVFGTLQDGTSGRGFVLKATDGKRYIVMRRDLEHLTGGPEARIGQSLVARLRPDANVVVEVFDRSEW